MCCLMSLGVSYLISVMFVIVHIFNKSQLAFITQSSSSRISKQYQQNDSPEATTTSQVVGTERAVVSEEAIETRDSMSRGAEETGASEEEDSFEMVGGSNQLLMTRKHASEILGIEIESSL